MQKSTYKKTPQLQFWIIIAAATSVILVFTITPWNIVPILVTEEVTVIAVTEYGCVGESRMGQSVIVSDCKAGVGDIVSATFYVPAMTKNGHYDRIQDKLEMVNP